MLEGYRQILIGIGVLLVRQHDVETDGGAAAGVGAFVGGFHNAGAAAGNHGETGVREFARQASANRQSGWSAARRALP